MKYMGRSEYFEIVFNSGDFNISDRRIIDAICYEMRKVFEEISGKNNLNINITDETGNLLYQGIVKKRSLFNRIFNF